MGVLEHTMESELREVLTQFVIASALIGGFAFAVVMQLVSSEQRSRLHSWATSGFMVATFSLLTATWLSLTMYVVLSIGGILQPTSRSAFGSAFLVVVVLLLVGVLFFLVGLSLLCYTYSRWLGVFASVLAALSALIGVTFMAILFSVPFV
jgi:hypothetical protein